jgi:hypothetical protein
MSSEIWNTRESGRLIADMLLGVTTKSQFRDVAPTQQVTDAEISAQHMLADSYQQQGALALGAEHLGGELARDCGLCAVPVLHRATVRAVLALGLPRGLVRQLPPAAASLPAASGQRSCHLHEKDLMSFLMSYGVW